MSFAIGSRACARCWKELTDAASMEAGIGPICRKLDNAILARMIPSNVPAAQTAAARVVDADLPEPCRPTWGQIMADLMDFSTVDWRKTVKRIEWVLSWGMTHAMRKALIEIVRALGYVGLAALLAGEASTGAATCVFENGRLYLRGSRNKAGQLAFKKVGGKFLNGYNGPSGQVKAAWHLPASQADQFHMIVMTYWPNVSGLEEAVAAAKSAAVSAQFVTAGAPADAAKVEKAAPEVTLTKLASGWIAVRTPYNVGFIVEIKKLPYNARKWNVVDKVWEVDSSHLDAVKALILKFYKVEPAGAVAA